MFGWPGSKRPPAAPRPERHQGDAAPLFAAVSRNHSRANEFEVVPQTIATLTASELRPDEKGAAFESPFLGDTGGCETCRPTRSGDGRGEVVEIGPSR